MVRLGPGDEPGQQGGVGPLRVFGLAAFVAEGLEEVFDERLHGYPGGQAMGRPPRIWQCRWGTASPASGPLLKTKRKPVWLSPTSLATSAALSKRWPRTLWSSGLASATRGIGFLGMMST